MKRFHTLSLLSAAAVFLMGLGISAVPADAADPVAYEQIISATHSTRAGATLLPVVEVRGEVPADASTDPRNLMAEPAAGSQAGSVIAGRVSASVKRMRLTVPFYVFGRAGRAAE